MTTADNLTAHPAHDEGAPADRSAFNVRRIPPGKATNHAHRTPVPRQHHGPAVPAGGHPVLPGGPVPRGVRAGRRAARPAAGALGRVSPAGCAGGLPSPARPADGRAAAGAPRGRRILAALALAGAALLALAGCTFGYPHACDGHGGTRVVLKGIYY